MNQEIKDHPEINITWDTVMLKENKVANDFINWFLSRYPSHECGLVFKESEDGDGIQSGIEFVMGQEPYYKYFPAINNHNYQDTIDHLGRELDVRFCNMKRLNPL